MRIAQLNLIRYGRFTDCTIELPRSDPDLHILYGRNEAGKSTALSSIADLLFGVPVRTPMAFLHEPASLRIGAVLEGEEGRLEIVRRKGAKDTLLGGDCLPLMGGERVLEPYLAGADRAFLERMFSLDHDRLQAGGREILEARDDAGQMLFSAASGITRLRERLREFNDEADALWSRRRARHRAYYVAVDRLRAADEALRECTLSADRWHEHKRALEAAEEAYGRLDGEQRERSLERNRLSRIRRVCRHVKRKGALDEAITGLGEVFLLPENAAVQLAAAEREEAEAATAVAALGEEGERAQAELATLRPDEHLLARAHEIRAFRDRGIESRSARAELPRQEAELEAARNELRRLGSDLGWKGTDTHAIATRIPPQAKVGAVRVLLSRRAEIDAEVRTTTRIVRECEEQRERLEKRVAGAAAPVDVAPLGAAIGSVRERGDLPGQVQVAESRVADLRARVERQLGSLQPGVTDEKVLGQIPVPSREQVRQHRDLDRECRERQAQTSSRLQSLRRELDSTNAVLDRLVNDEEAVSAESLDEARGRRAALWSLVKQRYVKGAPLTKEMLHGYEEAAKDLVGAYERTVSGADFLADRRFEHAEAAGRLAEVQRTVRDLERRLAECAVEEGRLRERGGELATAWTALWRDAPLDPQDPDCMLAWLEAREAILQGVTERRHAERDLKALRSEKRDVMEPLIVELVALGAERVGLESRSLPALLETALEEQRRHENEAAAKARLVAELEQARQEFVLRARELSSAHERESSWRERWSAALADLGLAAGIVPEAVETQLEIIERARAVSERIGSLRDAVTATRCDIAAFEGTAQELAKALARDFEGTVAEEVALEIERCLAEAERIRQLRSVKEAEVGALDVRIEERRQALVRAAASVAHLMHAAGVETTPALKAAIERSDRRRAFAAELEATAVKLREDGDGLAIEVLELECTGVDLEKAAAREAEIQVELETLQGRLAEAAEVRSRARNAFEGIGGSDAAARAAADREDALAELRDIAARYVRAKGSALLLEWAIDRYRRERQAPLLSRAGELFRILTTDSFTGLRVDYDDRDRPSLVGIRPEGEAVPVSGLSAGTADQLFLALRIAAVEEYTATRPPLPFVADDLFVNFDDDRAAAGLKVLEQLSRKTQVLVFTHHAHLVDIARRTLRASCHIVDLASEQARMPRKAA